MTTATRTKRLCAALMTLGLLADAPIAVAQLPPAIQADRLMVQADRQVRDGNYDAAIATLDRSRALREEHDLEVPNAFWFKRADVLLKAERYSDAAESATRYLEVAGEQAAQGAAARDLLDTVRRRMSAIAREADDLLAQADRQVQDGQYDAAIKALDGSFALRQEHDLEVPAALWFQRAEALLGAEQYAEAARSATRYLEVAGQNGDRYMDALELLDRAENEHIASIQVPEMVVIPAGSFRMGCMLDLEDCYDHDYPLHTVLPVHAVTISQPFALSKREVTFAQWGACVAAGGCGGYRPDDEGWGRGDRPVINVSWWDAQSYVSWLSRETGQAYRLPTESEWEYAARAGSATKFSWGNDIGSNRANCSGSLCGDSFQYTAPVGSFSANAFGLHDMHGNVWEWVEDCWNGSYAGAPSDGSVWRGGDCSHRVLRGGSWFNGRSKYLRSAFRIRDSSGSRGMVSLYGFRVARTLTP